MVPSERNCRPVDARRRQRIDGEHASKPREHALDRPGAHRNWLTGSFLRAAAPSRRHGIVPEANVASDTVSRPIPALSARLDRAAGPVRRAPRVAARLLVLVALGGCAACGPDAPEPPALTASALDSYLSIAPAVRRARHAARIAGEQTSRWNDRPAMIEALASVDWTPDDYLRVGGQVSAARLRIEDPALFAREFKPRDAPDDHVALVRQRLEDVRRVQGPLSEAAGD